MTLILVFMLLVTGEKVNAQPTQTNRRAEEKQTNSQPPVTPLDNRQAQIDNSANTASPSQNQERDAQAESFKAEQLRQNRIIAKATVYIAIFGGLSFLAALIYAIVSIRQWKAIDKQANHAGDQLIETRNLLAQNEWAFRATQRHANATRAQMQKQSAAMQGQLDAMKEQGGLMRESFAQNERAVKAAEDHARIAEESLNVGDAPYFGITGMVFTDFDLDRYPGVDFGLMNGGKTPAWHVHAIAVLIFGNNVESGERFHMQEKTTSPANNFYPSEEQKLLEYKQIRFAYTEERRRAIVDQTANLFAVVGLSYQDRRKVRHNRTFRFAWHNSVGQFIDYESIYL